jgi:hypothetical protein
MSETGAGRRKPAAEPDRADWSVMDRRDAVMLGVMGTVNTSPYLLLPLRTLDQARVAASAFNRATDQRNRVAQPERGITGVMQTCEKLPAEHRHTFKHTSARDD